MTALALVALLTAPQGHPNWTVHSNADPIDDSITISTGAYSDSGEHFLIVSCVDGELFVAVRWRGSFRNVPAQARVTYRFPPAPAKEDLWRAVDDLTIPPDADGFAGELAELARFVARLHLSDGTTRTAEFNLAGSGRAIAEVTTGCELRVR